MFRLGDVAWVALENGLFRLCAPSTTNETHKWHTCAHGVLIVIHFYNKWKTSSGVIQGEPEQEVYYVSYLQSGIASDRTISSPSHLLRWGAVYDHKNTAVLIKRLRSPLCLVKRSPTEDSRPSPQFPMLLLFPWYGWSLHQLRRLKRSSSSIVTRLVTRRKLGTHPGPRIHVRTVRISCVHSTNIL